MMRDRHMIARMWGTVMVHVRMDMAAVGWRSLGKREGRSECKSQGCQSDQVAGNELHESLRSYYEDAVEGKRIHEIGGWLTDTFIIPTRCQSSERTLDPFLLFVPCCSMHLSDT